MITEAQVLLKLPQEGEGLVTTAHITQWIKDGQADIGKMDSRLGGDDQLLLSYCVQQGLRFLGLNVEADAEERKFNVMFKSLVSSLNNSKQPSSIIMTKVYKAGRIPDVWSGGGRWA